MLKTHRQERGQVIVIMAAVVVGAMAFMILAVDGGMVFHHRRQAQNAADTAALAAALAKTAGADYTQAALNRATANGFDNDDPEVTVEVYSPPILEPFASDLNASQYIQVRITGVVHTAFVHLVYHGVVANTVEAIARARPPVNMADGYALYSTSLHECDGLTFGGNGQIKLEGGDAFSNSDGTETVGSCYSCTRSGSDTVILTGNTLYCAADYQDNGSGGGVLNDEGGGSAHIEEYQDQQQMPLMPEIPCPAGATAGNLNLNKSETLDPGNYSNISLKAGAVVTLNPGTYCVNGDFTGMGGTITGLGVTIKMLSGQFDLGGNVTVDLQAPSSGDWKGLLVYAEPSVSLVKITGGSGSFYMGTVYAPQTECQIRGGSGTIAVNSQLICRTNDIAGDGQVHIVYNEDENYKLPTTIEMAK